MTDLATIQDAVAAVVERHGGVRATARATGVAKAFISRLMRGHKTAPSEETLRRLGLRACPLYARLLREEFEAVWDANREKLDES